MTDDNEAEPEELPEDEPESPAPADPTPRRVPRRRDDSEAALGLEMARLFGMNPKTMMAPKSPPKNAPETPDDDEDGAS